MHRRLASVDGVQRIESNPTTGSVVVHYPKNDTATEQRLAQAIREQNELLEFAIPDLKRVEQLAQFVSSDVAILTRHSRFATAMVNAIREVNPQLKRATNNAVNLQLLLPLACAGGSLLFIDRKKDPFLWSILLLASFHTFLTLHQPPAIMPVTPGAA